MANTVKKDVIAIPGGCLRVSWYVDMEKADITRDGTVGTAEAIAAAQLARRMIVDPSSIATFYEVENDDGTLYHVELVPLAMEGIEPAAAELAERTAARWPNPPGSATTAQHIMHDVFTAMRAAEGIGGPEGSDYVLLMAAIASEANKRIRNYHDAREQEKRNG